LSRVEWSRVRDVGWSLATVGRDTTVGDVLASLDRMAELLSLRPYWATASTVASRGRLLGDASVATVGRAARRIVEVAGIAWFVPSDFDDDLWRDVILRPIRDQLDVVVTACSASSVVVGAVVDTRAVSSDRMMDHLVGVHGDYVRVQPRLSGISGTWAEGVLVRGTVGSRIFVERVGGGYSPDLVGRSVAVLPEDRVSATVRPVLSVDGERGLRSMAVAYRLEDGPRRAEDDAIEDGFFVGSSLQAALDALDSGSTLNPVDRSAVEGWLRRRLFRRRGYWATGAVMALLDSLDARAGRPPWMTDVSTSLRRLSVRHRMLVDDLMARCRSRDSSSLFVVSDDLYEALSAALQVVDVVVSARFTDRDRRMIQTSLPRFPVELSGALHALSVSASLSAIVTDLDHISVALRSSGRICESDVVDAAHAAVWWSVTEVEHRWLTDEESAVLESLTREVARDADGWEPFQVAALRELFVLYRGAVTTSPTLSVADPVTDHTKPIGDS